MVQSPGIVSPYQGGAGVVAGSGSGSLQAARGVPTGFTMDNGGWCIPTSDTVGSGSPTCTTTPPVALGTASFFQDPTQGLPQPPLLRNRRLAAY